MNGGFHQLFLRQALGIKLVSIPSEILLLQPLECEYVATHAEPLALLPQKILAARLSQLSLASGPVFFFLSWVFVLF